MNEPFSSPYAQILLNHLQYQGTSNDCGPYTTATVINALRAGGLVGDELAKKMNKPRLRGVKPVIRRIPNWATFPWGMVDVFGEYQLRARWWLRVPLSYLRPALHNGHILMPILAKWQWKPWMHVMTLIAWDEKKGWGFANTQYQNKNTFWVSHETFETQWQNSGRLMVEIEQPEFANP